MQNLKNYLNDRIKFLYEVANADPSEDSISTLGQIHEIKHILNWIDENEPEKTESQNSTPSTPKEEATPCN